MSVEPGAPAIIPGKAEMILQFRDADPAVLQRMEAALLEIVAAHQKRGPCTIECVNLSRTMPAPMEERLLDAHRRGGGEARGRACTCACPRAPATTRRSWRSACRRP